MFEFSTRAHKITDLPTDNRQFVRDADAFVSDIPLTWKKTKKYNYKLSTGEKQDVQTYHTHIEGEYWMARHSVIDGGKHPWEKIMRYSLGAREESGANGGGAWVIDDKYQHTEYEIKYTKVLSKWGEVALDSYVGYDALKDTQHLQKWGSTRAHYELGAPLTTREFTEFILLAEPGFVEARDTTCAYVIQLVAEESRTEEELDLDSSTPVVRGVYCSIERFQRQPDGTIDWVMCTASDSGGNVPKWLQNSMIAKSVSHDVPMFLDWLAVQP